MRLEALWTALRPHQWSKNVFVLAALAFASGDRAAEREISGGDVLRTLLAFVAFCLASSAVYLFNDVVDAESDRAHPEKRHRPIASGELPAGAALVASAVLAVCAFLLGSWIGGDPYSVAAVLLLYVAINLAYGLRLKRVVLLDAFCIAAGFVLRVEAGGLAAGAGVSQWLFLCTFFLALFLALNKRRAELLLLGERSQEHRANLREYTPEFIDQMVGVLAACTIVCYTMYTVDPETAAKFGAGNRMFWTVPFVAFGIGRYMVLVQNGRGGGNPARIFLGGDLPFLLNTLAWALVTVAVIYGWGVTP